jgi:hypothetical protein
MSNNIINGAKILKKGVRDIATGAYTPCWYSFGSRFKDRGKYGSILKEAVVIYARDYKPLPAGLNPTNDSDSRTDYFENDRVVFWENTPEYNLIKSIAAR